MTTLLKKASLIPVIIIYVACTTFSSCDSPAEKVTVAKENVAEAKEDLAQAREDYRTEVANFQNESTKKITAQEKVIADFKTQISYAKEDVKVSYEKQIAILEQKNANMKKRMEEYKDDGNDKWQSFKNEFNRDMDELGKSLHDFTINNKK